jgi:hypothetical protein
MGGGLGGGMGGAGAGGLTLAHQANAMARPSGGPPPGASSIPDAPGGGMAPPSSAAAALAADLVDKHQQQLSLSQVRDLSKYPLVAVDLYAASNNAIYVAGFPPKQQQKPSDDAEGGSPPKQPFVVGTINDQVPLKTTEQSHKTLRKWLSQDRTFADLKTDVLEVTSAEPKKQATTKKGGKNNSSAGVVVVESPQQWLGIRRFSQAPESIKSKVTMDDEEVESTTTTTTTTKTNAPSPIAPETKASTQVGAVIMGHGSLDGTTVPQGDDYDRVVYKLKLCESKKALTVLPEEMTKVLFQIAQHDVAKYYKEKYGSTKKASVDNNDIDQEDAIPNYPCAVAVPAVNCHDNSIEALLEAMGGTGVIFQRSICALQGALMESYNPPSKNMLFVDQIQQTLTKIHKEHQVAVVQNPGAALNECMLVLLTGVAQDCAEATAIQLSQPRPGGNGLIWGDFKVLTNVSYRSPTPEKIIDKCISELFDTLDAIAPEAGTPVAFLSYGSQAEQVAIQTTWTKLQKSLEDWENIPAFSSPPQAVALGTAYLGAVSHGRVTQIVQQPGKKPKADLGVHVHNVAPCAVGVAMKYDKDAPWTPVKTVFDFDRRVPAGPYPLDLVAAECVVYRENPNAKETLSDEALVKAIEANQGSKFIPKREQAALDLKVQVMQKLTRDGEWQKVGDEMSPLVTLDKDEKKIACEKVVLELSLGTTGMITSAMTGER